MVLRLATTLLSASVFLLCLTACTKSGPRQEPSARQSANETLSESTDRSQQSPEPWFEDITRAVGLDFKHESGAAGSYFVPESIGSGGALFDFDNDGRLDIYLIH